MSGSEWERSRVLAPSLLPFTISPAALNSPFTCSSLKPVFSLRYSICSLLNWPPRAARTFANPVRVSLITGSLMVFLSFFVGLLGEGEQPRLGLRIWAVKAAVHVAAVQSVLVPHEPANQLVTHLQHLPHRVGFRAPLAAHHHTLLIPEGWRWSRNPQVPVVALL